MSNKVQIVVPCYNPRPGWTTRIVQAFQEFQSQIQANGIQANGINEANNSVGLIVVNDGSSEGVGEEDLNLLKQQIPDFLFIDYQINKGKGAALRQGVAQANAPYIIITDIDFPYTTDSILTVYQSLLQGNDVSVGYRKKEYYEDVPLFRKVLSKLFRWALKSLFRVPTDDSQCGLKGFNQKGKTVFLDTRVERFLYDLEFLVLVSKQKEMRLDKIPVVLKTGIEFTPFSPLVLLQELGNFLQIFKRSFLG